MLAASYEVRKGYKKSGRICRLFANTNKGRKMRCAWLFKRIEGL